MQKVMLFSEKDTYKLAASISNWLQEERVQCITLTMAATKDSMDAILIYEEVDSNPQRVSSNS